MRLSPFLANKKEKLTELIMNQRLRFRISMVFMLVSLVPLLTLGFFSYYKYSQTIQEVTSRYSNDIINEISSNMLLRFKNINDISKILLNNGTVKDILSKNITQADKDYPEDSLRMSLLLKTIRDSNSDIRSVYILPEKNSNIYAIGDVVETHGLVFLNDEYKKNYKESNLYKDTINAKKNYIWWPTQNVLGSNVFILSEKLYDDTKGVLGVLVIHIGVDIMDSIYTNVRSSNNSKMYLIDENGRILFYPEKSYIGKQMSNKLVQKRVLADQAGSFTLLENNKSLFIVYNTFSVTSWKAIVITNYNELIADPKKIQFATLIISALCLAFILLIPPFITKGILNPIYKLIQLMKQGATGDIKVRFNVRYNDEISQLGESFNIMMSNIENLIHMVEDESNKKVEAEIKVLESHINPHFLYNTLASIYWNAMAKGDKDIGQMASSLSNFFRLGLNKGKEFTTIEREIEHVKEYLNIQRMMYINLFDYDLCVEQNVLKYRTIKLILQPLVENSLVHGFEKKKGKGFIKVEVFIKDSCIIYRVTDNGSGVKDFEVKGIDTIINEGYGLKNIRDRLKLYFNNDYNINCTCIPDVKTVFEIIIPAVLVEETN